MKHPLYSILSHGHSVLKYIIKFMLQNNCISKVLFILILKGIADSEK